MSNILQFVKILASAESQTKAPFALRNAKILLIQNLDLQMFPVEQQDPMRSQVQTPIKKSEHGPGAKWTITVARYQANVYSIVATPLATLACAKQVLSKLWLQPIQTFQLHNLVHLTASFITHVR